MGRRWGICHCGIREGGMRELDIATREKAHKHFNEVPMEHDSHAGTTEDTRLLGWKLRANMEMEDSQTNSHFNSRSTCAQRLCKYNWALATLKEGSRAPRVKYKGDILLPDRRNGVCGLQIWANPSLYRRRCWLIFPNQQDFRLPLNLGKSDPQPLIANLAKFVACRDLCKERAAVPNLGNSGKAEFGGGFK